MARRLRDSHHRVSDDFDRRQWSLAEKTEVQTKEAMKAKILLPLPRDNNIQRQWQVAVARNSAMENGSSEDDVAYYANFEARGTSARIEYA